MTATEVMPARINQPPFVNNLLVNPGFEVWQRGAGPFGNLVYGPDEWYVRQNLSAVISLTRSSSPLYGTYCATWTQTGTPGDTFIQVGLETAHSLEDQWLTFSLWVKSSIVNGIYLRIGDETTAAGVEYANSPRNQTTDWEQLTVTKKVRTGLAAAGSWNRTAPVGLVVVGTGNGSVFSVDGAVLAAGYFPEGVPYVPLHPAEDLERCLRFYHILDGIYDSPVWSGIATNAATYDRSHQFPSTMAAIPTVTFLQGGQSGFPTGTPLYYPGKHGVWSRKTANAGVNNGYHYSRYSAEVT